jgi:ABC-2 type transport system permease protein
MLLRSVFGKTIRDLRWPTFWVAISLAIGGGYFTALFPTYTQAFDLEEMMAKMPDSIKALIGGMDKDLSTATGFLNVELFPLILPALMVGFAVALCSGFTAGVESRGTIDILLSYPVPRWRMVLEKMAALVIALVVAAAVMLAGIRSGRSPATARGPRQGRGRPGAGGAAVAGVRRDGPLHRGLERQSRRRGRIPIG